MKVEIYPKLRGKRLKLVALPNGHYVLPGDYLRVDDKFTKEELAYCNRLRDGQLGRKS